MTAVVPWFLARLRSTTAICPACRARITPGEPTIEYFGKPHHAECVTGRRRGRMETK